MSAPLCCMAQPTRCNALRGPHQIASSIEAQLLSFRHAGQVVLVPAHMVVERCRPALSTMLEQSNESLVRAEFFLMCAPAFSRPCKVGFQHQLAPVPEHDFERRVRHRACS